HLSLVAGITRAQVQKLNDAGIATVRALAGLSGGGKIKGIGEVPLERLREQAKLQVHKRDTGRDRVEVLPARPDRGFARLPEPDPDDIFLDFEGDPLYPDGLEYLAGLYRQGRKGPVYAPFWAHDHAAERESFERLIDAVVEHLKLRPGAFVYHYGHYEEAALKRLASRHGTREEEVDDLLRGRRLVDLLKVVREAVRVSEPSYSLKNLEVFYMDRRGGEVRTAGESIVVYERWRSLRDDSLLGQIAEYNQADCRSTMLLRDWLLGLRPAGTPWFDPAAEPPDEEKLRERQEAEARRAAYERALLERVTSEDRRVRELMVQMIGFHRREEKPQWWAMFDRRDRPEEDLIDDPECLGGLRRDRSAQPFAVARSTVFTYKFPPQDSKLGPGDQVKRAETLEPFGTIYAVDEGKCEVQVKLGRQRHEPPEELSIIPAGPIQTKTLREAVARFAASVVSGGNRYPAVESLLARRLPRVKGIAAGSPLVDPERDIIEESKRVIAGLKNSYVFIQGPPGSGKTYTASHVILDRIRAGKRVGIASNSHKAINNLLRAVVERAEQAGVSFRGVKKSDPERQETCFGGRFVRDVGRNQDVDPAADLIAGTAWLFAREQLDR
ncbi:TM0106 family RecB-like putative nuclease, partial [candidate division WOR-3 bacterium]|nr:TM0106 family RecB-like putative nuclease [candidate division WOR-3 bacterium]